MIIKFIELYQSNKDLLQKAFKNKHPESYEEIVKLVIEAINPDNDYNLPDKDRIVEIDQGDYQGTLVYIIPEVGYQPLTYWAVLVGYGSCSGCDTLQAIRDYSDDKPSDEQIKDYMMLALHIVQGLKKIGED